MPNDTPDQPHPAIPNHIAPRAHPTFGESRAEELVRRFSYHAPKPEQLARYDTIRALALHFAQTIAELTPDGREQSLALTHLDEVVMFANAAIARRS